MEQEIYSIYLRLLGQKLKCQPKYTEMYMNLITDHSFNDFNFETTNMQTCKDCQERNSRVNEGIFRRVADWTLRIAAQY